MADIKTVLFLISIFAFHYVVGQIIGRYSTELDDVKLQCEYRDDTATEIRVCFHRGDQSARQCMDHSVILKYSLIENKTTFIDPKYANVIDASGLQDVHIAPNGLKFRWASLRRPKTWHSGVYVCFSYKPRKPTFFVVRSTFQFFEHHLEIIPCKDRKHVQLWCKVFDLDVYPFTMTFRLPNGRKESVEYPHITSSGGRYNITGKTVVPLTEIGDPPKTIKCKSIIKSPDRATIERQGNLTKMMISKGNTINCFPNLQMEKRQSIWEKVGKRNITFSCIFDIPHEEEIKKIEWFHHDTEKNRLMYNWSMEMGQHAEPDYKEESFTSIAPVEFEDRQVTSVTLKTALVNHTGDYTCKVTFSRQKQSKTAHLVVYHLETPILTAVGCSDQKVRLECNTRKVYPEPEEIVLSFYNPNTQSRENLTSNRSKEVKQEKGLYNITVKMIALIDQIFPSEKLNFSCDVVLSWEFLILNTSWTSRETHVTDSMGNMMDVCSPKVEIEQQQYYVKANDTPVVIRCKFDIPEQDEIKSIEWIHQNFTAENVFYRWEKKTNKSTIFGDYEIPDKSLIIPRAIEDRQATTLLKLKMAGFEHNGNYSCRVNFVLARSYTKRTKLVVYAIPEPHYFKATRCTDNQTVGLECKAHNIRPKPEEVAFYVLNPNDNTSTRLNDDAYIKITEKNGSFAISARMIALIQSFRNISPRVKAKCEVILHSNVSKTTLTVLADPDTSGNTECHRNLRADKHQRWKKAGEDVDLRCTFNVPFRRPINFVHWIHQKLSRPLLTWERRRNITKPPLDKTSDMEFVMTLDREGRNVSTLKIKKAKVEHSGNYTCKILYGHNSSQSDSSLLVVYQLSPSFTAIGCSDERVRLECKDDSALPAPPKVEFSLYDPMNRSLLKLNDTVSTEIEEVNGTYNFTTRMFTRLDQLNSVDVSPNFMCDVILDLEFPTVERRFAMRTTYVTDRVGKRIDVCSPSVEVEPRLRWLQVGTESVSMRCKFDIPLLDEIESIKWFHHKMSQSFNKSEITIKSSYHDEINQSSFIVEGRNSTLNLDKAKIEHSGNYTCWVNYRIAGNSTDSGEFVVYQINKPYYFNATVNGDLEVLLECKAGDLFPEPEEIVFSKYDPDTNSISKLDKKPFTEVIPVNNGLFNISANMSMQVNETESVEYICDIVLSKHLNITESTFKPTFSDISDPQMSGFSAKQKTAIITGGSVVGLLPLLGCLVYVLKRFRPRFLWRRKSSREDEGKADEGDERKADEEHVRHSWWFPWKSK